MKSEEKEKIRDKAQLMFYQYMENKYKGSKEIAIAIYKLDSEIITILSDCLNAPVGAGTNKTKSRR